MDHGPGWKPNPPISESPVVGERPWPPSDRRDHAVVRRRSASCSSWRFRRTRSELPTSSIPYFGLSISRVDPLPHQLEAVYDYLLKLARVRFLLADDAGAGKTIMAGLLIRELKLRGLAERILDRLPCKPRVSVAARTEGQVRREVRGP